MNNNIRNECHSCGIVYTMLFKPRMFIEIDDSYFFKCLGCDELLRCGSVIKFDPDKKPK